MADSLAREWLARLGRHPLVAVVVVISTAVAGIAAFLKNARDIVNVVEPAPPPKPVVWTTKALERTRWHGREGLASDGPPVQIEFFEGSKCYLTTGKFVIRDCTWELDRTNVRIEGTIPPRDPSPTPVVGDMSLDGRYLSGYIRSTDHLWTFQATAE